MQEKNLFELINNKKTPIKPTSKNETTKMAETIEQLAYDYAKNLSLWRMGNKSAGARARRIMYDLVKLSPVLNKAMITTDKGKW